MEAEKIHPVIRDILAARGCRSEEDMEEFLSPRPQKTYDPFLMKGMDEASEIVIRYAREKRRICIYGDYDADGVTSVSLLLQFLSNITKNLMYYIPSRFSEGYGLNTAAADIIHEKGAELIITVDCGCVSAREVDYIKKLGMQVIVTDHHNVDDRTPDCVVLDPKQKDDDYPFDGLCGCGVAFKLAQAISRRLGMPKDKINCLLDLVGIATIGDIVPLVDENRTIVKYGLDRIARCGRPGLTNLIQKIGMDPVSLTSVNIAFGVVPHINAAGRMKDASIGVELMTAGKSSDIDKMTDELKILNNKRKSFQEKIFADACAAIDASGKCDDFIIYDAGNAHEGVTGIVAGKLKDKYYRPVVIVTDTDDSGFIKGTGRSIKGLDLHEILSESDFLFTSFGGHAGACGFKMKREDIQTLRDRLAAGMKVRLEADPQLFDNPLICDAVISSAEITLSFTSQVEELAPFGEKNPEPVFRITDVEICGVRRMGKNGKYLKLICRGINGASFDAVWFDVDEKKAGVISVGDTVDLMGSLSINVWKGRASIQCVMKDFVYPA